MSDKIHTGLTSKQVEDSRCKYGENVLTPPERVSLWKQFLEKFEDPIIRILLVAWLLSMVISGVHCWGPDQAGFSAFLEPLGILFAIILASSIGFIFEVKAARAFEVLNSVNDDVMVTVVRDGKIIEVPRRDIVVGDIVMLGTGDEVPADGTLLEAHSLQINESTLTGEPVISKTVVEADFDKDATYPSNRVLRSTTVVDGHGVMCVDLVGDATEYGKVNQGALIDNNLETPLQLQLKRLAGVISKFGYVTAALTFVLLSLKVFFDWEALTAMEIVSAILHNFMIAVTLIVVAVPEGLPMSVTLSLALSMNRMLKSNNLVRKMHACETMGAATVICTDKTGTLTQNRMQVHETVFMALEGQTLVSDRLSSIIKEGIAVNSTANLNQDNDGVKTIGNPTEAALLLWLNSQGADYMPLRNEAKVVSQLTFSTERKYMATVVDSPLLGCKVLYVKGAPEIVLANCNRVETAGGYATVEESRAAIEEKLLSFQDMAMRTLGFAYQLLEDGDDTAPYADGRLSGTDLTFVGFVAISDPVRSDVPEAVKQCLQAGIDVKIVTGDTPGTAREIARQIGIYDSTATADSIITGPEFEALSDDEAAKRVMALKVMCRARPMDKQRLVRLLQEQDAVVAVTGDGTNDAPALKVAQVGLSMGDGTSVAKEASDITIIDNSFTSIAKAVMWGRSLYKNIQRFLLFQLTINVAACAIVMIGSLVGTDSPLTITQMLWVNLIMDTFAAGALASLPPSRKVMNDRPRKSGANGDFIITRSMGVNIFVVAALFVAVQVALLLWMGKDGLDAYEQSEFFTFFVMLQFWNMFNAKAYMTGTSAFKGLRSNPAFLFVCALILVGQFLIVTFGGAMFNVVPMTAQSWGIIISSTSLVLWVGEAVRLLTRK